MPTPTTPLISSFTGADETPLSEGGVWSLAQLSTGHTQLRRVSNAAGCQDSSHSAASYYNAKSYAADQEMWFTMSAKWTSDGFGIFGMLGLVTPGSVSTIKGYLATSYGSGGDIAEIYRIDSGTLILLGATVTGLTVSAGDQFYFGHINGVLTFAQNRGSGWTNLMNRTDTTYGAGFVGLGCDNQTVIRMTNMGGGSTRPDRRPAPLSWNAVNRAAYW